MTDDIDSSATKGLGGLGSERALISRYTSMSQDAQLSESDRNAVRQTVRALQSTDLRQFQWSGDMPDWYVDRGIRHLSPFVSTSDDFTCSYLEDGAGSSDSDFPDAVQETPPQYGWNIRFSDDFMKSASRLDMKLQGRILKAITQIVKNPMVVKGNTAKPLTGDMNGLWRWRIGDFRLVYDPHVQDQVVVLLSIGARGEVYK